MERRMSNLWLLLFWLPVLALVCGLVLGCANDSDRRTATVAAPSAAVLHRLVAQELDADSPFDNFASSNDKDAAEVAARFRPVVTEVVARECRPASAQSFDCTLDVVLRFPAIDGRESHTTLERRLRHDRDGWQLMTRMP